MGDTPNAAPACRRVQPWDLDGIPSCANAYQHLGYNYAARDFECINSESRFQGVTFLRQDVLAGATSTAWVHAFDVTSIDAAGQFIGFHCALRVSSMCGVEPQVSIYTPSGQVWFRAKTSAAEGVVLVYDGAIQGHRGQDVVEIFGGASGFAPAGGGYVSLDFRGASTCGIPAVVLRAGSYCAWSKT